MSCLVIWVNKCDLVTILYMVRSTFSSTLFPVIHQHPFLITVLSYYEIYILKYLEIHTISYIYNFIILVSSIFEYKEKIMFIDTSFCFVLNNIQIASLTLPSIHQLHLILYCQPQCCYGLVGKVSFISLAYKQ